VLFRSTEKVGSIKCSRDDSLSVKDLAAISTHVNYIVAVNTGPFISFLNTFALKNVRKWFIFDNTLEYSFPNFYNNKTFDEILSIIEFDNFMLQNSY